MSIFFVTCSRCLLGVELVRQCLLDMVGSWMLKDQIITIQEICELPVFQGQQRLALRNAQQMAHRHSESREGLQGFVFWLAFFEKDRACDGTMHQVAEAQLQGKIRHWRSWCSAKCSLYQAVEPLCAPLNTSNLRWWCTSNHAAALKS